MAAQESQRPRGRLHVVVCRDVVLDQNRNPMQRTADMSPAALVVEVLRDGYGIWICLDYRVKQRVQGRNAPEITFYQILAAYLTRSHCGLKLGNALFNKVKTAMAR